MKKFLASGIFCFLALSSTVFAECNFESYIQDQIDLIDDEITVKEHTITHYDNLTIYQMGYQIGRRRAYYDMLNYLKDN